METPTDYDLLAAWAESDAPTIQPGTKKIRGTAADHDALRATLDIEPEMDGQNLALPASPPDAAATNVAPLRKAVTHPMRVELKKRIETAVLRTQGYPGGYPSFTAFMDGAAARELARLEATFNGGEPFEPNAGRFRAGRPLG